MGDPDDLARRLIKLVSLVNRMFLGRKRRRAALAEIERITHGLKDAATLGDDCTKSMDWARDALLPLDRVPTESEGVWGGRSTNRCTFCDDSRDVFGLHLANSHSSKDVYTFRIDNEGTLNFAFADVAGRGPAALLISTMFVKLFDSAHIGWHRNPSALVGFLDTANDAVLRHDVNPSFLATQTGCLDLTTGRLTISHAGMPDLIVLRGRSRRVEEHRLDQAPAVGIFDRAILPPESQYRAYGLDLAPGDVVLLGTDDFEQSMRQLAPADNRSDTGNLDWTEPSGADSWVSVDSNNASVIEQFGPTRIVTVLNAVLNRSTYEMGRYRNEDPGERIVFDFSQIEPTPRSIVLALAAAELVFRLIPHAVSPAAEPLDRESPVQADGQEPYIDVDIDVADFLAQTFRGYGRYFGRPVQHESKEDGRAIPGGYRRFLGVHSHSQDTIAALAIGIPAGVGSSSAEPDVPSGEVDAPPPQVPSLEQVYPSIAEWHPNANGRPELYGLRPVEVVAAEDGNDVEEVKYLDDDGDDIGTLAELGTADDEEDESGI